MNDEEYKVLLHSLKEDILVTDTNGIIVNVSHGTGSVYNVNAENWVGRSVYQLEKEGHFTPLATPQVLEKKERVTFVQTTSEGNKLLVTGLPVFDENKDIARVVSYSHDVTELMEIKAGMEELTSEIERVRKELDFLKDQSEGWFVAKSGAMKKVMASANQVAGFDVNILLLGESGVGKSELARMIHSKSGRSEGPFIEVNCGAIPDSLFEAELFGYEGGAFTGASKHGKKGFAESAHNGTLFLDEIGELSMANQVKVLKLTQDKTFYPVGGRKEIHSDFRLVTATNKKLKEAVLHNEFREDLYFRLNVVPLTIPPLRERKEDILPLIYTFLNIFMKRYKLEKVFSSEALHQLLAMEWKGNVRELINLIERLVVTTLDKVIQSEHLSYLLDGEDQSDSYLNNKRETLKETLEKVERERLMEAKLTYGTTTKMAAALGISQPSVVRKLKKYNVD
ncbi:sigma-54 interaction domain-containing protein [Halobacillus yeomjeoni]|uniref:HTH-type transcriptional regulatory protein TyrR n=1 Tax=Halobacillus yeomjeoni TaxID=311194 RepID=A0A931MTU8_9BACI|nr:sigma 54-interacting transcriptional regulator [Halobacillus yeomjeoni]MBH0229213.1 sigma 54-interacting transcriptional regulator [Halobacillus yeomjeoni]